MSAPNPLSSQLLSRWSTLSAREQRGLLLLGLLLGLVVFWSVAIAPAWQTLRQAPARRAEVTQQTSQMQALQRQAQALQGRQVLSRDQAVRTLQSLSTSAGAGLQLSLQGEFVAVQLKGVRAQTLAAWLAQARTQSQALPVEVHLTRALPNTATATPTAPASANAGGPMAGALNAPGAANPAPAWDGSLLLKLPTAAP
jgi:general secretion pathway protein M